MTVCDSDGNYTLVDGKAGEEELCKGYNKNKLITL